MNQEWAFVAYMACIAGIGVGISWFMSARVTRMSAQRELARLARVKRLNAPVFRRPVEFGPLCQPWDEIERIRAAIIADQLGAVPPASTEPSERAESDESTDEHERAVANESTVPVERIGAFLARLPRAAETESTVPVERAAATVSTGTRERVLFWLQWWQDSGGLFAQTGAAA